jgi:hypothetical protein
MDARRLGLYVIEQLVEDCFVALSLTRQQQSQLAVSGLGNRYRVN